MKRSYEIYSEEPCIDWHYLSENTQELIIRKSESRVTFIVCKKWNKWITSMKLDWFEILSPKWRLTLSEIILFSEPYSLQIEDPPSYAFNKQLAFLLDNTQHYIKDVTLCKRAKEILERYMWSLHEGLLTYKNYHPLDFHINFVDRGHQYHVLFYDPNKSTYLYATNKDNINDAIVLLSVTTFIDTLFEIFDGVSTIKRMMANKKKWNDPNQNKYYGKTMEEILHLWLINGGEKSGHGSHAHNTIENYHNNQPYDANLRSFQLFKIFEKECIDGKLVPFRAEPYLYNREIKMVGAVDMLYSYINCEKKERDINGKLHLCLVDWKCVEDFTMEAITMYSVSMGRRIKKMGIQPCTANVEDCKYRKYCIQLMLYKWMLEQAYDIIIDDMWIIIIHPQQLTYRKEVVIWDEVLMSKILLHRKMTLLK